MQPLQWTLERLAAHPWLPVAIAAGVTLAAVAPAVSFDFVSWDDAKYVSDNGLVLAGLTPNGIRRAFTDVVFCNWAPLTILSYQLDATLFGREAWGFHLSNVLLFSSTAALLFILLRRLTAATLGSLVATLAFSLHPQRVESVAWVSDRKDLLSVLFLILTLLAYADFCRRPALGRYLLVAAAATASLLAKASLLAMPVLLLLLDVWPLRRMAWPQWPTKQNGNLPAVHPQVSLGACLLEKVPIAAITAVFAFIAYRAQSDALVSGDAAGFLDRRLPNALFASHWYILKAVMPFGLQAVQCRDPDAAARYADAGLHLIVIAAVVAAAVWLRRPPYVAWALAWMLAVLAPVIGFVPFGAQTVADRYTYAAHLGPALVGAVLFDSLWRRAGKWRAAVVLAVATLLAAEAVMMQRQLWTWRDGVSFWAQVLEVDPTNPLALEVLACRAEQTGDLGTAERLLTTAVDSPRGFGSVLATLSRFYYRIGRWDDARDVASRCAELAPDDPDVARLVAFLQSPESRRIERGVVPGQIQTTPRTLDPVVRMHIAHGLQHARTGQFEAAAEDFRAALAIDPTAAEAHNNLGMALLELKRAKDAAAAFERAVAVEPQRGMFQSNLARALVAAGRADEAVAPCREAIRLDPDDQDARSLLVSLERAAAPPEPRRAAP